MLFFTPIHIFHVWIVTVVVSKCLNKCNIDINNQSGKVLLSISPAFKIQTNRVNRNRSLVNKTELDIPLTLDLSSFIVCDLNDNGISPLYSLHRVLPTRERLWKLAVMCATIFMRMVLRNLMMPELNISYH